MQSQWQLRFFTIWTGQQLSHIGTLVAQFALIWWLTRETGSAVVLASASMVALAPHVLLGPFVGPLIDRWNRRTVILISDSFIALVSLWLAFLFWQGTMQVWHVYVVMLLRAFGGVFHGPAFMASVPLMVPKKQLTRIAGMSFAVNGMKGILGPSLGALCMELLPLHGVMMIDVVTALLAVLAVAVVGVPQPDEEQVRAIQAKSYLENLKAGLRFVLQWPGLLVLLAGVAIVKIVLFPAFSFIPLLIYEYFGKTSVEYGIYQALGGAGMMLGGLVLTAWGGFQKRIHTFLVGFIGLGVGAVVVGSMPASRFWPLLAASAFMGVMFATFNSATNAILQGSIPEHMQGRFFSLFSCLASLTTPIGLAIAGPLAEWFGIPLLFQIGGTTTILLALAGLLVPALLGIEKGSNWMTL